MNTDPNTPIVTIPRKGLYSLVTHTNSKRSLRKGLNTYTDDLGHPQWRDVDSAQVFRDPDGHQLERHITPALLRCYRSRYIRHVGAKQLAKLSA